MSGPGALYVGSLRSLCLTPAPSVSCPSAPCVGPQLCIGALVGPRRSLRPAPTLCVGPRRSLGVGARRSLCRGPALSVLVSGAALSRFLCRGPAVFRARRSLCQAPAVSVSGPKAVGVRWSFWARPQRSVSGPGALSFLCRGPALGSGPALSVSGLGSGPALSVSGPGAVCVGPRRSLALCVGARRSVSGSVLAPGAFSRSLCLLCVVLGPSLCGGRPRPDGWH